MDPDDFDINAFENMVLTTGSSMDSTVSIPLTNITNVDTVTISDYTADTVDFTDMVFTTTRDVKRTALRENGELPVDIWAKMYNNSVLDIEDKDDEFCF